VQRISNSVIVVKTVDAVGIAIFNLYMVNITWFRARALCVIK
jgi:hypothetical protein